MKRLLAGLALSLAALALTPAAANAWASKDFAYRKAITLDAKAAGLTEGVKHYPTLIRLDSSQFTFKDAQATGADIRFYDGDDKTPLAFQIESFDPSLGLAMVWVDAPEMAAGAEHKIWMYYGAPKAQAQAPAKLFDANFQAVYHFSGANPAADATGNGNSASAVTAASAAAIGTGAAFDGQQGVTLPAALSVNPANGFTFEAWVREKAPAPKAVIYANGPLEVSLDAGVATLTVGGQKAAATTPMSGDWAQIAVVGDAAKTTLYVNGQVAATVNAPVPALNGAATLGSAFQGEMDEVRVSNTARTPGWLMADFASQKSGGELVAFGADEKPSGSGFGYFGVIFKNITPDAWAVIAVLMVMAVLSWFVMWNKGNYIGAVTRGNRLFDQNFRQLGSDLTSFDAKIGERGHVALKDSSLYHLYQTGLRELHARGDLKGRALTGETVEAIRASLDAEQVEENQKLDRFMVLLTIAISGGPFIGLLGTVLGVMITFAAIAAAGDVNVNAIAPGIAAALLATVAGLFVAIPALFGYNYLSSRNADISAKMQVFCDQFITRLAEVQRNASILQAAE